MQPLFAELLARFAELHQAMQQAMDSLSQEALDWVPGPEMNPISVIVTHTAGAERSLIGELVGGEPAQRDRTTEFRPQGVDAAELAQRLAQAHACAQDALEKLSLTDLSAARTRRDGTKTTVAWALLHALDHTAEHTGHIQITRQLWNQRQG
jgi:hypothetical protein